MHLRRVRLFPERFPTHQHYPFDRPILQNTPCVEFGAPVTFFVGENGTGKSTLLEALCRKCGIHIWRDVERLRVDRNPYEEKLHQCIEIEWADGPVPGAFFGSDRFRTFAESLDEWAAADPGLLKYFGGHSLVTQSHGQSLMAFFRSRFTIKGLYLLDEPETALSPRTQLELLGILTEAAAGGVAQFIVASHSPILLACPRAVLYSFDGDAVRETTYAQTDHYRVYKEFMDHPPA